MKGIVCILLLSTLTMVATAKEPVTKLIIWSKDETKVAYAFAERPKITFIESELVVKTNRIEVKYYLDKAGVQN